MQKGASCHAQQALRPLHAASGNVVNHIPTLSHTHTHRLTHTHTNLHTHIFMSRNSANVPNCPRHGHPAPPHLTSPRPLPERCRWRWWAWQTVCCCCCFLYIIFCYFAVRSKCGFYVFVYGKIREMAFTPLSLSFSRSRPLLKVPKVTIMKFTHHLPRQGCLSASTLAASPNFFLGLSISFLATPN